jgi:hypothetical protein
LTALMSSWPRGRAKCLRSPGSTPSSALTP